MIRRFWQSIVLLFPLFTAGSGITFAEVPLNVSEIGRLSERIKGRYENHVYTVNAWSNINRTESESAEGRKTVMTRRMIGTAFPVNECGYLITPQCVVRKAEKISVVSRSGEELEAHVIGTDTNWEIAVLKIISPLTHIPPSVAPMNSIDSGNQVILLGVPESNRLFAQPGVISEIRGTESKIVVSVSEMPGTTGTPVFTTGSQLLGFITYHLGEADIEHNTGDKGRNLYLVVPMDYMSIIARSIISSNDGNRGWLGITINLAQENINSHGIIIQYIFQESPASLCGLEALDRITEYNGSPVSSIHEMCEAASKAHIGEDISLKVMRSNSEILLNATLIKPPTDR